MNIIYRIWYSRNPTPDDSSTEFIAYIGRTKNDLTQRIRQHFMGHPLQKKLDIRGVSHIDYTTFPTVADMYVAEVILINKYKPPLNVDDKAPDELTFSFELGGAFEMWEKPQLMEKWMNDRRSVF
jgi:Nuclease subunit of the excinuclease complex